MYLKYENYVGMGGKKSEIAFSALLRKAERLINAQAGGKTGERLSEMIRTAGVPQAVSDCVFDLLIHFEANAFDGANIQSESRSLGGMSESVTYMRLSKDEADAEAVDIIENYFYGAGLGKLLYRGACLC